MKLSFDDNESFKEAAGSLCFNNPPSDPNKTQPEVVPVGSSSSSNTSMQPQESPEETRRSEDSICINNPPSTNPNALRRMESSSSMPP